MPTVQQILDYANLMYPRSNDISDANKIIILNQIMDEINNRLLRVRWENDPYTMYTISNQASYTMPTDCNADDIIKIMVSNDTSGNITSSTVWDEYTYVGLLDDYEMSIGTYYMLQNNVIFLFKDSKPIQTTDLVIQLFYYREPTYLSSVSDTPEIETKYHNLFKYGLIQNIASIGDNPDTLIADYWQKKYDEEMAVNIKKLQDMFDSAPLKTRQIQEYW